MLLLLIVGLIATLPAGSAILVGILLLLSLLLLVLLLLLRLRRHDAVVVLGMLEIVFRHHAVAGGVGIARELEIFLIHIRRGAADFHFRSGRIKRAVGVMPTAAIVVMAAACVLRPAAASA